MGRMYEIHLNHGCIEGNCIMYVEYMAIDNITTPAMELAWDNVSHKDETI